MQTASRTADHYYPSTGPGQAQRRHGACSIFAELVAGSMVVASGTVPKQKHSAAPGYADVTNRQEPGGARQTNGSAVICGAAAVCGI